MSRWIAVAGVAVALGGLAITAGGVLAADAKSPAKPQLNPDSRGLDHCSTVMDPELSADGAERYEDVPDLEETEREEPDSHRPKSCRARDVGHARVGSMDAPDDAREAVERIELAQPGPATAAARTEPLRL